MNDFLSGCGLLSIALFIMLVAKRWEEARYFRSLRGHQVERAPGLNVNEGHEHK